MKVGPSGSPYEGWFQTATCCDRGDAVVVNDVEKALFKASGGDQEDERKRIAADVSKFISDEVETGAELWSRDEFGGCPADWPSGVGIEAT